MKKLLLLPLVIAFVAATEVNAQDLQRPLFTVGAVTDPQYADAPKRGGRTPRETPKRLQTAVDSFNRHKVDLVVNLGDFIDWDDIHYGKTPETTMAVKPVDWTHFETLDKIWKQIEAPRYFVLGNHEWYVPDQAKDGKKPERVLHKFGFKDKAYYSIIKDGFRFVILDGTDRYMYAYPKGSDEYLDAYNFFSSSHGAKKKWWNGAISGKQLTWLRQQLVNASQEKQSVVICCHFPIHDPVGGHTLLNYAEVRALLDDFSNIVLWLNGHDHNGGYAVMNEGQPNQRHHLNLKGMQNADGRYYRLVFFPDRIQVFQAEAAQPERVLNFGSKQNVSR